MKKFLVALAVLAAVPALAQTASVPDWPACEVRSDGWQSSANPSSTAAMRVARGGACSILRSGSAARYELAAPPRNGTVTVDGGRAVYRPNAAFAGTDSFVLRVRLASGGTSTPWFTTVNVEVR